MIHEARRLLFCFCILLTTPNTLVESTPSSWQEADSKSKPSRGTERLSTSSIHRTSEIVQPSEIRNKRNNLLSNNEQFIDDNAGLDSAFLYSDQIMQNLLKNPKPLSYARSNFFLNILKPRTTRYNAWDDHSLMHFGKRSVKGADNVEDKVVVKRSTDEWSPNNVLHFGKKSTAVEDSTISLSSSSNDRQQDKEGESEESLSKKSADPWHSMMSFGKKSQNTLPGDDNELEKREDPWHHVMSFGKRSENPWDSSTLHFGKKDDPWHQVMSFGKRSENPWDSSTLHFGKRDEPWHHVMSFGKRSENPWDSSTLHFGKKDEPWHHVMSFGKRSENPWDSSTLHFGKRDEPWHQVMSFGKKSDPWHNMMSFGKRSENPWDHNTLHFGKRGDVPWHSMMSFGKKSDPWHSMMSFGKKYDSSWDHNTLHFGKRDDPWHNMMSFGKRSDESDADDLEKRQDPWHSMMSFGKRFQNPWDNDTTYADKRQEPWHNMMSFGKRYENPWDHNTLHFGKRDEPWHNMMSFGKKSENPWDHNTLHFGKRDEPWHNMMSFGKKSDNPWDHNTLHFGKREEPWHNMMSFGKRPNDLLEDFEHHPNPWEEYDRMQFNKKADPWDHNTLHFGKRSNASLSAIVSKQKAESQNPRNLQKRSIDMWNDHDTMHFGKKSYPWEDHNTMHFGKKSDPWDSHNTMHFGKKSDDDDMGNTIDADKRFDWDNHNTMHFGRKRDPWDYHNTMHFGKRDPFDYHNTMHFGKRNPWEQQTMHFGKKRNPWDYHNTMHFGKRSDLEATDSNSISQNDIQGSKNEPKPAGDIDNSNKNFKINNDKKDKVIKKRSPKASKSTTTSKNNHGSDKLEKTGNEDNDILPSDNQKIAIENRILKRSLKSTEMYSNKNTLASGDSKQDITPTVGDKPLIKPSVTPNQKNSAKEETHSPSTEVKSRINKRSIQYVSPNNDLGESLENLYPTRQIFEEYSKDDFPDGVLHFGKQSIEDSDENEVSQFDVSESKRFDDYWDNHNTMHFGKRDPWDHSTMHFGKRDPWDHSTMHFGKRDPWDHSTMHFGKRDPWDYHNTLHFGKKFDPWEGHTNMHFGKRSPDWNHNVMHFGKRANLTPEDLQNAQNAEDLLGLFFDPVKLKDFLQAKYNQQGMNAQENDEFLTTVANLETLVNSHLKDERIPFEEKLLLLRSYLKPLLKILLDGQLPGETIFDRNDKESIDRDVESLGFVKRAGEIPSRTIMGDTTYDEDVFPTESEEIDDDDAKTSYLTGNRYSTTKRSYLGKPELKRYFIPFQGPKSIVYPHAWFASQIRRSSLPRTTDYAKNMELRMAEKKEDPFNSYMHFGRR